MIELLKVLILVFAFTVGMCGAIGLGFMIWYIFNGKEV